MPALLSGGPRDNKGLANLIPHRAQLLASISTAVLLVAILAAAPALATDKSFVMTTSVGSPLYRKNGKGLYNLLVAEIFQRLELTYELIWLPSQRSLAYTNNGNYDGNLARSTIIEKKNKNMLRVPEPVYEFEFMAYSRNRDFKVDGWSSLDPYVVGIINGWKIVERNVAGAKLVTGVNDYEQLFNLLDRGRVDVAILDRVMGGWKLQQLGLEITPIEPPIIKRPMFIYLHKRHARLVPRITRIIKQMKNDGSFGAIYARALPNYLHR